VARPHRLAAATVANPDQLELPVDAGSATGGFATLDDTGLAVPAFQLQEFLRTLGYRTYTTSVGDKPGFTQLASEAHAREW
jgi:hypothetical protein